MADFATLRDEMLRSQIEARGITVARVLAAMRLVPREAFVDEGHKLEAYEDRPVTIAQGQTMSQPYIVALMAQAAQIKPQDHVLEIGTGSGYGAAVLGELADRVCSIERHAELAAHAAQTLKELGYEHVHVGQGDGTLGWPPSAPFDAIIVTASGPAVPEPLKHQLAIGGRLVIPVGPQEGPQRLLRITRTGDHFWHEEELLQVLFVPLIGQHGFGPK